MNIIIFLISLPSKCIPRISAGANFTDTECGPYASKKEKLITVGIRIIKLKKRKKQSSIHDLVVVILAVSLYQPAADYTCSKKKLFHNCLNYEW